MRKQAVHEKYITPTKTNHSVTYPSSSFLMPKRVSRRGSHVVISSKLVILQKWPRVPSSSLVFALHSRPSLVLTRVRSSDATKVAQISAMAMKAKDFIVEAGKGGKRKVLHENENEKKKS